VIKFLAKRLLSTILVLWLISISVFGLIFVVPADPARIYAGPHASGEVIASIRQEMRLDDPVPLQYLRYMGKAIKGDLGRSVYGMDVLASILERLPATMFLALSGFLLELLLGLPAGILAATRAGSRIDRLLLGLTVGGTCIPNFWLGLVLLYFFGYILGILPLGGSGSLSHLILPALTLGIGGASYYARILRSNLLEVFGSDYIRTAKAKGLVNRTILWRHAIPNAIMPIVTLSGFDLGLLFSGTIIVEMVFSWPGVGLLTWKAIERLDIPMIMGTVLFAAFFITIANLAADIIYVILDPRIRLD
jgi:peptide/nickel transport system permease protein